ncbi:type II secretion system protein [Patescibacteria group bacterium]|nr:MAG: type II secretion system protein [Patescibacteria group bacterium]
MLRRIAQLLVHDRRGITLPELLTVISIITVLASTATVSYGTVREYARDLRRVGDMSTLQGALELYYQNHYTYPADTAPGSDGLVLGLPETSVLADNGFTSSPIGRSYLLSVAPNPRPYGVAYVYRTYNADGSDCDAPPCARYTITFALEGKTDTLDKGVHSIGSEGVDVDARGQPLAAGLPSVDTSLAAVAAGGVGRATFFFRESVERAAENPVVERTAVSVVAPVATGAALLNVVSSVPLANLPQYLLYFFTQPVLYIFRPRRRSYGVVYNAYSRLPVDLAIVRLRKANSAAIVRSMVTDVHGRFQFVAQKGVYRIEVTKPGYRFPTEVLREVREDVGYLDLYHGESIRVDEDAAAMTPNIPIDPVAAALTDRQIRRTASLKRVKHAIAVSGLVLSGAAFLATPSIALGALVAVHGFLYAFFRRLAVPRRARSWGIVYEEGERRRAVGSAIIRMYALPYHKLVDSAVTDARGRYHFLVGPSSVYLTVTKDGYLKTETEPIDLSGTAEPTVIANDLPLRKAKDAGGRVDDSPGN